MGNGAILLLRLGELLLRLESLVALLMSGFISICYFELFWAYVPPGETSRNGPSREVPHVLCLHRRVGRNSEVPDAKCLFSPSFRLRKYTAAKDFNKYVPAF